ncbi:MAG: hypothetical protein ACRDP1_06330 [Nocardioidaceae bacterium]
MTRPDSASDRAGAAESMLSMLFPPPLRVQSGKTDPSEGYASFVCLPHAAAPRLLVQVGRRSSSAAVSVRRQMVGRRWRTRVSREGSSALVRTGLATRLGSLRLDVVGPPVAASVREPLRHLLDRDDFTLTIPVGPARSNRKPVLQVVAPDGAPLAFVKVGHSDLTRRLVASEHAALSRLAHRPADGITAPAVLGLCEWRGLVLLAMTALEIPTRRMSGPAAREQLLSTVREIAACEGLDDVVWAAHPLRAELLDCWPAGHALRAAVERLDSDVVVRTGTWHGDLNPGNVAVAGGRALVWDWERFSTGVPVGFDLLHHDFHEAVTVRGRPAYDATVQLMSDAGPRLEPVGVSAATAALVARAYFLTIGARYFVDGQRETGSALGNLDDWLVPALTDTYQRTGS